MPRYKGSDASKRIVERLQRIGDMRRVTPQKSLRSSCISPPKSSFPLTFGSGAVQYARAAEEKRESDAKAGHTVSTSTDAEAVQGQRVLSL